MKSLEDEETIAIVELFQGIPCRFTVDVSEDAGGGASSRRQSDKGLLKYCTRNDGERDR